MVGAVCQGITTDTPLQLHQGFVHKLVSVASSGQEKHRQGRDRGSEKRSTLTKSIGEGHLASAQIMRLLFCHILPNLINRKVRC